MSQTNRNRRSYGFSAEEPKAPNTPKPIQKRPIARPATPKPARKAPPARRKKPSINKEPINLDWLALIWKVPVAILLFIFRTIGWLWNRRPKRTKKEKVKGKWRKRFGWLVGICLLLTIISSPFVYTWANNNLPDPDKLTDRIVAQSTKIYDRTGEHLLYEVFENEKRTLIELDEVSPHIINGAIATEDTKFYEHKGIRPLSIIRAVLKGLLPGKRIQGTSTLTQQLVKNAILTNERSITRKLKEAILSIRLEQKYTKDQILKIYFNEISYGSTNYGVESAAQAYFGVSAKDVTLEQAATLAGMPKAPGYYLRNLEDLKTRRNFVLARMYAEGYITEDEKLDAQAAPFSLSREFGEIKAPHFVLTVRDQLIEEFGEQAVDTGGLKVLTTLDWEKQQIAERVVEEVGTEALENAEADNTSLVAIDPKTGQVLALIGSKDFYDEEIDGQFNVATLGKRQPGSSFKPIVYTAAFERGYTPETILYDVVTDFGKNADRSYEPLNYDLSEHGPVTMRKAIQGSLNIPAVKTLYLLGDKGGVDFAKRLGYTTFDTGDFGLTLVLGGGEVRPIEHVAAYATFANEGVAHETSMILSVTDPNGDVLYEWKAEKGEQVIEPEIAATISDVLSDDEARAYAFGTGGILTIPGQTVAAKTGTTNGYIDGWTVGYTPDLVAGVWAGNTDNTPMKAGFGGSRVAGPIWKGFMKEALADYTPTSFPDPPANETTKPVLRGTESGGVTVLVNKVTGNIATSSTPEKLIEEKTFIQPHSILHYVIKDEPNGPLPEDPTTDGQYDIWEQSILDWVERKKEEDPEFKLEFGEAPTTVDDEYSIELIPTMTLVYPAASSTITSTELYTDLRVSAPRGVSVVRYFIDEQLTAVEIKHPFNLSKDISKYEAGLHTLRIEIEDDIGNKLTEIVPLFFGEEILPPVVIPEVVETTE